MPEKKEEKMEKSFEEHAEDDSPGLIREFWDFMMQNKVWWIAPIMVVLLLLGGLLLLSGTGAAPLIYTLF